MFFRTVVLTATLTAAVMPADAHAGSVPAGSQFIETIHRANRAISITLEYDTLRTEIGFARAGVARGYRWDAWAAQLGYGVTFHTDTIVGQRGEQHFGSLTLAVTGRF